MSSPLAPDTGSFDVVFVCTGNRARSPTAEAVLSYALRDVVAEVNVRSVGILDLGRVSALPAAVRAAAQAGIDLTRHRAQSLRFGELASADLVVGFEPGHISVAVVDGGAALAKTFSLVELGLLLEAEPRGQAHLMSPDSIVQRAHERRGTSFLNAPQIEDPEGATDAVFVRTLASIRRHVSTVADVIFGASPTP